MKASAGKFYDESYKKRTNNYVIDPGSSFLESSESTLTGCCKRPKSRSYEKTPVQLQTCKELTEQVCQVIDKASFVSKFEYANKQDEKSHVCILKQYTDLCEERELIRFPSNIQLRLDVVAKSYPNSKEVIDRIKQEVALSSLSSSGGSKIQPILIYGEPGLGKTAVISQIAKALKLPSKQLHIGSMQEAFQLSGLTTRYSTGQPGAIAQSFKDIKSANAIFTLDELDKGGRGLDRPSVYGPLHTLLESSTAHKFRDECLELELNTSNVTWFATANDLDLIPKSLLSRFSVVEIIKPSVDEMPLVIRSIYRNTLENNSWGAAFQSSIDDVIVDKLKNVSDLRSIQRVFTIAFGKAALRSGNKNSKIKLNVHDLVLEKNNSKRRIGFF